MSKKVSKKQIIETMFHICEQRGNFVFDNDFVKKVLVDNGSSTNPYDMTKVDSMSKLPACCIEQGYTIIHLGNGRHKFAKCLDKIFHKFEPIDNKTDWDYRKSILNLFNSSESNRLSIANNQRILHHFLFEKDTEFDDVEIINRPKTYFPHRTKLPVLNYRCGGEQIELEKIQIEVDLTLEFKGVVGVFEAKNGKPKSFNVCQLYHPFLIYHNGRAGDANLASSIKDIFGVYLVSQQAKGDTVFNFWKYTFDNPDDIASIRCLKSSSYRLVKKEESND